MSNNDNKHDINAIHSCTIANSNRNRNYAIDIRAIIIITSITRILVVQLVLLMTAIVLANAIITTIPMP